MQYKGLLPILIILSIICVVLDARDWVLSLFKRKKKEED